MVPPVSAGTRLSLIAVCALLLAGQYGVSLAATLDSFEIEATDSQVNVHLHGDEMIQAQAPQAYQGGTAIILPNTQLSARLVKQGLPVVMDGQARFIGRAVPAGNNQVKILLPNVPVNRIPVHISQSTVQLAQVTPPAAQVPYGKVITLGPDAEEDAVEVEPSVAPANSSVTRLPEVVVISPRAKATPSQAKTIQFVTATPVKRAPVKLPVHKPTVLAFSQPSVVSQPTATPAVDYLKQAYALLPQEALPPSPQNWQEMPATNYLPAPPVATDWSIDSLTPPEPAAPPELYLDMPSAMLEPLTPAANPSLSLLDTDWYTRQALDQLEAQLAAAADQARPPWLLMLLGLMGLGAATVGLVRLIRQQLSQRRKEQATAVASKLPFSVESVSLRPKLGWASIPKKLPFEPPLPQVLSLTPRRVAYEPQASAPISPSFASVDRATVSSVPRMGRPGMTPLSISRKTVPAPALAGVTAS